MIYFARWKIYLIAAVCVLGIAYAFPNFLSSSALEGLPSWVPQKQMNLGLDLRGGSHVLMQVDTDGVVRQRLQAVVSEIRTAMRRAKPKIGYRRLGVIKDGVGFTVLNSDDLSRARRLVRNIETGTTVDSDGNRVTLVLSEARLREIGTSAIQQSIEIVRRRIDETGTREPTIQRQGSDRIIIQLPGVDDPSRIIDLIGKTAKMTFHMVDQSITAAAALGGRPPPGSMIVPERKERGPDGKYPEGPPREFVIKKKVEVSGDNLVDAQQTFSEGRPVVSFRFDSVGARKFARVTQNNVGRPFAIILDNEVISAPVIRTAILGGSGIIEGGFTVTSAKDLSLLLRAGALPADLTPLEQRSVGASLGADSIRAGKIASVGAVALVIVFMALAYGRFGIMADVALMINLLLITAALSLLQATLTLPGIAGIVLTIGMAVDANVLIFERIREEQRNGRTPISSVDEGYKRALGTIIDANVTTLLAAILLYSFGSGPVKGFAVTLGIGLMTSMFTAIMITRFMVVYWLMHRRPQRLPL